jgi:hypothetical protein
MRAITTIVAVCLCAGPALAEDKIPISDGTYMRSADYCEQFRQGKLDFIEFSVSEGGHAYHWPETGCVVHKIKKLRTNRYAIEGDCLEMGEASQNSFILDVEGTGSIRIDGQPLVSCEAKPAKAAKKATNPANLVKDWNEANVACRGGSGDDPETFKACDRRADLARRLEKSRWCYDKEGQAHASYRWHKCTKRSIHYSE